METNERNPLKWSAVFCSLLLRIVAAYIRKWSGGDSPTTLSPEARDEIRSRIIMDLMTGGEVPEGISPLHHVFRTCRRWRVRGWAGDTESHRELVRASRAAARKALRDPGSAESEEERNKSPFRGCSDDARQPRPERILAAIEEAESRGLAYVSGRQARARRKPQRAHIRPPSRFRAVPTGRVIGPAGETIATVFRWEPIPETEPTGPYDRKAKRWTPYVAYKGSIPNRSIGYNRTPATGTDPVGHAMAAMAVLGRDARRHFTPSPLPAAGIPQPEGLTNGRRPRQPLPPVTPADALHNLRRLGRGVSGPTARREVAAAIRAHRAAVRG